MKRILIIYLALIAAIGSPAADTLQIALKTATMVMPYQRGTVECNLNAQIPVGASKALLQELNDRATEAVKKAVPASTEGAPASTPIDATSDNAGQSSLLTTDIENAFFRRMLQVVNSGQASGGLTLDLSLTREYETPKLITFRIEAVIYTTGNRRGQHVCRLSLLKPSGKTLTWASILQKKSKARFQKTAAQSLESFFSVRDWINLRGQLNVSPASQEDFPLPSGPVAVTRDGLILNYDAGEIAPAGKGQPWSTVSLQKAWLMLTPAAKKILR